MKNFVFRKFSSPILLSGARKAHINYLRDPSGPHVVNDNNEIIHSLTLSKDDLDVLHRNSRKGIRLYFCRHEPTSDELNMIIVPIDDFDQNVFVGTDPLGNPEPTIINTLDPCPDKCPSMGGDTSHEGSFSTMDFNYVRFNSVPMWCKPNRKNTNGGGVHIWLTNSKHGVVGPTNLDASEVDLNVTSLLSEEEVKNV